MPSLFDPLKLRSVTLRNRIGVSPMCMYSASNGHPQAWHMVHLGALAVGGAGLVMAEATAVEPRGRISLGDTGLWCDEQIASWKPIVEFIAGQGSVPGIQLAHAGRKAGTALPWEGGKPHAIEPGCAGVTPASGRASVGEADASPASSQHATGEGARATSDEVWADESIAPSPIPFAEGYQTPRDMTRTDMDIVREAYVSAARRAQQAGFKLLELHFAHGYLMHSFLSPLTNQRSDTYGGELPGRLRFPLEVAEAVRQAWPADLPLLVRISASDWLEGGWDLDQSITFARLLKKVGVDLVDCSSGGINPQSRPPVPSGSSAEPLFQVPLAESIRREASVQTAAVGLITTAQQAESIIAAERADLVLVGRAMLRDPHWALRAAKELGAEQAWPRQYLRAQ